MKKVVEVSIGGIKFTLEEDAYFKLSDYLKRFEATITQADEVKEVMEDVEARVGEIFHKEQAFANQVVDIHRVQVVIDHLGEVEAEEGGTTDAPRRDYASGTGGGGSTSSQGNEYTLGEKKIMRDVDNKMLTGVCAGLATYLKIDVTFVRIAFVLLFFAYGMAGIIYIIMWIVSPKAETVSQKLEMQGYAPTAENIRKYTSNNKA